MTDTQTLSKTTSGEVTGPTEAPTIVALLLSHADKLTFEYLYLFARLSILVKDA